MIPKVLLFRFFYEKSIDSLSLAPYSTLNSESDDNSEDFGDTRQ